MNEPTSNAAGDALPVDPVAELLTALRLDAVETSHAELGARLATLEAMVFQLQGEVRKLRADETDRLPNSPHSDFRVVAVRISGDRLVINDRVGLEEAKDLRERLIAASTFAEVVIEPAEGLAISETGEGRFLDTIDR